MGNAAMEWEEVVEGHQAVLYRFALGLVDNEAAACELVRQTFSLWASSSPALPIDTKVKSWLSSTLCRRFFRNHPRHLQWPIQAILDGEEARQSGGAETVEAIDPFQVMECLHAVSETFRVPLLLFYLQEHSCKEIAEILAMPVGAVITSLSNGKRMLHGVMEKRIQQPIA